MANVVARVGACALLVLSACAPPARVSNGPATPVAPKDVWTPPASATAPMTTSEMARAMRGARVPADVTPRLQQLLLVDVVDLALGNNPQTRISWAQARAAAASYGAAYGRYMPALQFDFLGGPQRSVSQNPALIPATRVNWTPSATLTYLLWDFGARGGTAQAAHEALFAADLSHNATVQSVVLQAEGAYFAYQAARELVGATATAEQTAKANLSAAERRHDVGLATIADVLQARTALAQAQLVAQGAEGDVQAARANLAVAMGIAANGAFDVRADTSRVPALAVTASVDSMIERAVRSRPDVAAARALARQSDAQVRVARSALLPALNLTANTGRVYSDRVNLRGETYALTFGLSVPLFNGNARQFDLVVAQENAAVAAARAEQTRIQAVAQVFSSFYGLRFAAQRVTTANDLLTSAVQSEEVARGRYAEGVGSILDLLTAQSALADARAQDVGARWTWRAALAQLARDAGVLGPRGDNNLPLVPDTTGRPGK